MTFHVASSRFWVKPGSPHSQLPFSKAAVMSGRVVYSPGREFALN